MRHANIGMATCTLLAALQCVQLMAQPFRSVRYALPSADYLCDALLTPDNGAVMLMSSLNDDLEFNNDLMLVKVRTDLNPQWAKRYDVSAFDEGGALVAWPGGGYGIACSFFTNAQRGVLMRTDALGAIQETISLGPFVPYAIVPHTGGGFLIGGRGSILTSSGGYSCGVVGRLAANGQPLWMQKVDQGVASAAFGVLSTSDGHCLAMSQYQNGVLGDRANHVMLFDGNGQLLWSRMFDSPGQDFSFTAIENEDGFLLCGATGEPGLGLTQLDHEGHLVWQRRYPAMIWGTSIIRTSDGGYLVAGMGQGDIGLFMKLDSNCEHEWNEVMHSFNFNTSTTKCMERSDGRYMIAMSMQNVGSDVSAYMVSETTPLCAGRVPVGSYTSITLTEADAPITLSNISPNGSVIVTESPATVPAAQLCEVAAPVGIAESLAAPALSAFPIPAQNELWISCADCRALRWTDAIGRSVPVPHEFDGRLWRADVAALPQGTYAVQDADGRSLRVVVTH